MIYEVKVYADSTKVLNKKGHIKNKLLKAFKAKSKDEDFLVQFIDHQTRMNYDNKVTIRVRKSEYDEHLELQYKKRYPINDHDVEAAIKQAEKDGINGELEVEYGINTQTLSVTHVVEVPLDEHILPALDVSHQHITEQAPDIFAPYLTELDESTLVGPVEFERHIGKLNSYKIKLEKWDIGETHIVELSSKVKTPAEAFELQQALIHRLTELKVYEATDQLKTEMIFNHH
ncbi:hypothetical protein ERX37_07785 [Macrococcus hajekii]|uniref:CYTH domain-containing protein n=1 Tax=Macrococcus hajekii TaxID=198482 RepID=A0A4R6BKH1_9STAP|nr:CYTH domain-containing protein [Macrococcus hajekii]TDM02091.1 hypothetical protein ERX37_07785 [Macrococcus hajekii]GGB10024.1 hypothetical protein GCM10007190_17620 [Macrococcus hajekii]